MAAPTRVKRKINEPPREHLAPDEVREPYQPFTFRCRDCGEPITTERVKTAGQSLCERCDPEACYEADCGPFLTSQSVLSTVTPTGIATFDRDATEGPRKTADRKTRPENPEPRTLNPEPLHAGPRTIALADLARNRFNPRQEFDEHELRELAVSLQTYGMLQPVLVRPILGPTGLPSMVDPHRVAELEIVAGERRALAAKLAGIQEIPVSVVEVDDARACELAIEENRRRRDISQVEYARGLKRLAELKGLLIEGTGKPDAARVAADQGLSDGGARNLFRLLDAPEAWQQRVISQEISGAHLRDALPYLHKPKIEAALAELLKRSKSEPLTERQWKDAINRTVSEHSVAINGSKWVNGGHVEYSVSEKHPQYAELEVVTVSKWGSKQKRALNVPLAKKLLSEKKREKLAKLETSEKKKPIDHNARQHQRYEKERRGRARQAAVANWTCNLIADAVRAQVHDDRRLLALAAGIALRAIGNGNLNLPDLDLPEILTLPPQTLGNLLASLFDVDRENPPVDDWEAADMLPDLLAIAAWLGVDHAAAWRGKDGSGLQAFCGQLTEAWLETLDDAELRDLAEEWRTGLSVAKLATTKREELERSLTENRARVMPLPKDLAAILKPPKAKAKKAKKSRAKK